MDTIDLLERAVLACLTGTPVEQAAARFRLPAARVAAAAAAYRAAGRAELEYAATRPWRHVTVHMGDRQAAELVGCRQLGPALEAMRSAGTVAAWWYLRKPEGWRVRYLPHPDTGHRADDAVRQLVAGLRQRDEISGWTSGVYEPEVHAFGGPEAMDVAHDLFAADGRFLLRYLADGERPGLGRRELMVLLPTAMARAAGLDWYEQGQIWQEVAQGRTGDVDPARVAALAPAVRTLLSVDTDAASPAGLAAAVAAYTTAGVQLRELATTGRLHRGLRGICARHVIFAANRLGIAYADQALLAATACAVILG